MERPHTVRGFDLRLITILSVLTGLAMGISVSFGLSLDSLAMEFGLWTFWGVVWVVAVLKTGASRPFWTLVIVGLASGVVFGAMTQALWSSYMDSNPETFVQPTLDAGQDPESAQVRLTNLGIALVIGPVWGALMGGITVLAGKVRSRRAHAA